MKLAGNRVSAIIKGGRPYRAEMRIDSIDETRARLRTSEDADGFVEVDLSIPISTH